MRIPRTTVSKAEPRFNNSKNEWSPESVHALICDLLLSGLQPRCWNKSQSEISQKKNPRAFKFSVSHWQPLMSNSFNKVKDRVWEMHWEAVMKWADSEEKRPLLQSLGMEPLIFPYVLQCGSKKTVLHKPNRLSNLWSGPGLLLIRSWLTQALITSV